MLISRARWPLVSILNIALFVTACLKNLYSNHRIFNTNWRINMSKTVVITGANRGIGLAIATEFKILGFDVIALCRQTSASLTALNVRIIEGVDVATAQGRGLMVNGLHNVSIDNLTL
jgi:hypothetical protein